MIAPRSLRGFTLIELMLAIALGMLVIYTAYAGFRMASQCIVTANRLSLENSLMRSGYSLAHEQLDFWTNLDDPNNANQESLRASGINVHGLSWSGAFTVQAPFPTTVGLPFAPMNPNAGAAGAFAANTDPTTGAGASGSQVPRHVPTSGQMIPLPVSLPLPPPTSNASATLPMNWENDTGFDPTYLWAPHDPRTWFRGNPIEKPLPSIAANVTPLIMGRYGAYTNVMPTPTFDSFTVTGPYPPPQTTAPSYQASYTVSANAQYPVHLWYGRQLLGLSRAIGWYGLFDYLPANAMYGYYTTFVPNNGSTMGVTSSAGNLSMMFTFPNWGNLNGGSDQNDLPYPWSDSFLSKPLSGWATIPNGGWYWNFVGQGMGPTTMGIYSLTSTSSYSVTNPYGDSVDKSAIDQPTIAWRCYSYTNSDYSATYNGVNQGASLALQYFISTTLPLAKLMATGPANWPMISVGTGHYVKSSHFVNITKIHWVSPVTGQVAEFSFNGISTTLRGARMQRRPGSAAGWANWDNAPGAANDANLDGAQ
jgi:Tfp pilus assembly protein PilE